MIEMAMILLYSILISTFSYVIASYLMKTFKVSHPSNRFIILLLVLLTVFSTLLFVGQYQQNGPRNDALLQTDIPMSNSMLSPSQQNGSSDSPSPPLKDDQKLMDKDTIQKTTSDPEFYDLIRTTSAPNETFQTFAQTPYYSTITSYFIYENVPFNGIFYDGQSGQITEEQVSSLPPENQYATESTNVMSFFIIIQEILILAGIIFLMFSLFAGKKYTLRKMKATPCTSDTLIHLVASVAEKMHIKPPRVLIAQSAPNAFVFAYPTSIVFSEALLDTLSEKEIRMVVTHELSHIKHHDIILKPFLQTLRIMFMYNPIVHLLYYRLMKERELLADLHFLHDKKEKILFMETLMKINDRRGAYHDPLFTSSLKHASLLSFIPYKDTKVGLSDRFNCLFGRTIRKTVITMFLVGILLVTNIGLIVIAQGLLSPPPQENTCASSEIDHTVVTFTLVVKEQQSWQCTDKEDVLLITETSAYAVPSCKLDQHDQCRTPYEIISVYHHQVITQLSRSNIDLSLLRWINGTDQRLTLASPL
jgi:beta-lactamase regulating signal transducer with metallopeptidase domain